MYITVDEYLETELQAGRILGPIDPAKVSHLQISRFGGNPKSGAAGKVAPHFRSFQSKWS